MNRFLALFLFLLFLLNPSFINAAINDPTLNYLAPTHCYSFKAEIDETIAKIKINKNILRNLPICLSSDWLFFSNLIAIDYNNFFFASDRLKDDEVFIKHFISKYPAIIQYASDRLKNDPRFIISAVKLNKDSFQYTSPKLLDNKIFMGEMIKIDPKNFIYVSERLQDDYDLTLLAVKGDGRMLEYASDELINNKIIAREAIKSYVPAIIFIGEKLANDKELIEIANNVDYSFLGNANDFFKEFYSGLPVGPKGARGYRIVNQGYFFGNKKIIDHPQTIKWQPIDNDKIQYKLVTKDKENKSWKVDFASYPDLIEEIEEILIRNRVDQNTIDVLNIVANWQIEKQPPILAFDLYLLRNITDNPYLGDNFANIVSLLVIVKKIDDKWIMTIIDAKFDINIEMDIKFQNGYKKYKIWDLIDLEGDGANIGVLIKVEDKDSEYFELFAAQPNGKYAEIYRGGGYSVDNY